MMDECWWLNSKVICMCLKSKLTYVGALSSLHTYGMPFITAEQQSVAYMYLSDGLGIIAARNRRRYAGVAAHSQLQWLTLFVALRYASYSSVSDNDRNPFIRLEASSRRANESL